MCCKLKSLLLQDKGFLQAAIDEGRVGLLQALADLPGFDANGCSPHEQLHLLGQPLLEKLLQKGLSPDARMRGTKTFLLHKVLPVQPKQCYHPC